MSDPLPPELADAIARTRAGLGPLASRVIFFSSTGSTNDEAARLASTGSHEGVVIVADAQTAGRGRQGRIWLSPPGNGLYVSVILDPGRARRDPMRATSLLTLAAGVALAEAVEETTGLRVDLKWPNDLYVARRKLAGILAESVTAAVADRTARAHPVVLGYGLNVGSFAYPPELSAHVTSLEIELGRPVDRFELLAATLRALARRYADLLDGRFDAILDAWRPRAPTSRGAPVSWTTTGGAQSGTTCGVDADGALLVRAGHRLERVVAGVTWL